MLLIIGVVLTVVSLLSLSYFLLAQTKKSSAIKSFGIFTLIMATWLTANFIGANFKSEIFSFYFLYIDFILGPWLAFAFWGFTAVLLEQAKNRVSVGVRNAFITLAVIASMLPFTGLMFEVGFSEAGVIVEYGHLYGLYALILLSIVAGGAVNLFVARKHAVNPLRRQIKLMSWAMSVAATVIAFANLGVPQLTSSRTINLLAGNIAYLGVVFFASITTYAIVRHRLFDLRLAVARVMAYAVSMVLFASIYGFVVFGFAQVLLNIRLPLAVAALFSAATGGAALLFHGFKVIFDKKTSNLFYQDAYDTDELYDEYNKAIVSTIDLDVLLRRVSLVISKYLKTDHCVISVQGGDQHSLRSIGDTRKHFKDRDAVGLRKILPHYHQLSVVTDDLTDEHRELREMLASYDISLLVRLTPNIHSNQEGLGFISLGHKKSGNPFTSQDIKVMETLANELIIAMQNALRFEEIERFNETLQQRVNEATAQLRHANKRLKELNESKDDFIGMASHQLRTPLTSIKGYISLVMDGDVGKVNANQRKLLQQAFVSSQRMVFLIADLLNVSRLRTGKFVIERAPTDLSKLISDELAQLKEAAAVRNVELIYYPPAKFPVLPLDETKTRQVIMNFIDNAIYYTPSGGHIKVELTELSKSIELRVVDDGIGVPKSEHHNLFTKFYRAKNAQRARPDGTGLGLFMAKKVIVAQGGAPIFSSEEGKGSTFGFTFPKDLKPTDGGVPELVAADD